MENLCVDLKLIGRKVQFKAVSCSNFNRPVELDYVPPLGDGRGFAGLELLLISFCGCVSTAVVALLRKAGKSIICYECSAIGIRQEKKMKKVIFEAHIQSENTEKTDMDRVLSMAAEISQVWLAIKNNIEVETKYKISC